LRRPGCDAIVPLWSANRRVPFKIARKNSEKLEERFE
jgi:hypothetical protein